MKKLVIAMMTVTLLAGCTTLKKVTGQQDDRVLPGQREEVLPPDQQVSRDPKVMGGQPVPPADAAVQTTPINPPPGKPSLAMPKTAAVAGNCDPKVDLCPEPLAPDPLPPPSPVKAETPKKVAAAKTVNTGKTAAKPVVKKKVIKKKKVVKPAAPADAAAPATPPVVDPNVPVPAPPKPQGQ